MVEVPQKDESLRVQCLLLLEQEGSINRIPLIRWAMVDTNHKVPFADSVSDFYSYALDQLMAVPQRELFIFHPSLDVDGNTFAPPSSPVPSEHPAAMLQSQDSSHQILVMTMRSCLLATCSSFKLPGFFSCCMHWYSHMFEAHGLTPSTWCYDWIIFTFGALQYHLYAVDQVARSKSLHHPQPNQKYGKISCQWDLKP